MSTEEQIQAAVQAFREFRAACGLGEGPFSQRTVEGLVKEYNWDLKYFRTCGTARAQIAHELRNRGVSFEYTSEGIKINEAKKQSNTQAVSQSFADGPAAQPKDEICSLGDDPLQGKRDVDQGSSADRD